MGTPDPETTRQTQIMVDELRGTLQRLLDQRGLNGPVLVSPYRDARGILRVIVNLDGWQAVAISEPLSVMGENP